MRLHHLAAIVVAVSVVAAVPATAQAPVAASDDPESLFTDPDPQLHANKQVVMHVVRDLLEAGHWDDAGKYISDRYIQHNPGIPSGLAPVQKAFSGRPPRPIPDAKSWNTQVVSVVAEDDLVVVAFRREMPNPRKEGATYTTTWFDMWRVVDGKVDEHWDFGTIAPPGGRGRGGQ